MRRLIIGFLFCAGLWGQSSSTNATRLQGRALSPAAPSSNQVICWNVANNQWQPCTLGGGGVVSWGGITGTLSAQTDLQNALNLKANLASPTFTGTVTLPSLTVTNGMLAGSIAASKLIGSDITAVGTIGTGTWAGTTITVNHGGTGVATLTGPIKGNGTSAFSAAAAADIVGLFSTCSGTQYLGADGACHSAGGGGGTGNVAEVVSVTFSATPTFTCGSNSAGTISTFTVGALTGNITSSTLASCTTGQTLNFVFVQDGTGGRTVVMPTNFDPAPISPTASKTTTLSYFYDGTNARLINSSNDTQSILFLAERAAPGTPASGAASLWPDSTNHVLSYKANNASTVSNTVVPASCTNQVLTAISAGGVTTCSSVANAMLSNSSMTIAGHSVSLGGTQSISASDVGLGSVTNNAQTQAAIVPNTTPTAGQVLVGNAGGTAYAPVSMSSDATMASTGAVTIANLAVTNAKIANSTIDLTAKVTNVLPLANSAHVIFFSINGASGGVITAGNYLVGQTSGACTIIGWTLSADQSGSISIDLDAHSSSAPPSAPSVPNTTTDKISASAPMALSSAQTASGGTSAVSTWTTSRAQWDAFGVNVTGTPSSVTRVTGSVWCQ